MNTGDCVGLGMPARDRIAWAKEMLLDWIDKARCGEDLGSAIYDFDECSELLKQRNRVARFLNLPVVKE